MVVSCSGVPLASKLDELTLLVHCCSHELKMHVMCFGIWHMRHI